jgi:RNA polymerase sigma-70 factor, ECF subfamily
MLESMADDITGLLARAQRGDHQAVESLARLLHLELENVAKGLFRSERRNHTLKPADLVGAVFERLLLSESQRDFAGRVHFVAAASIAMRRVLVDHARARLAQRRGGPGEDHPDSPSIRARAMDLADVPALATDPEVTLVLDELVTALESEHPRQAEVLRLRFFGGSTVLETAHKLGISEATVARDWEFARCWLRSRLDD